MKKIVLGIFFCVLAPSPLRAAKGDAGEVFNFGVAARAQAMANAFTSVAQDGYALYYNPGGLGRLEQKQVSFMHATLFQSSNFDYVGYAQPTRLGSLAAGLIRLDAGSVVGKDELNQPAAGASYSETGFSFGWGHRGVFRVKALSLGGSLKVLQRSLGGSSDRLSGFDMGAQFGPLFRDRMNLGFALKNFITFSSGDTDDKLPLESRVGASYKVLPNVLAAMDVVGIKEISLGAEYVWGPVAMRMGYAPSVNAGGVVALPVGGFGLNFKSFRMDYAVSNRSDLGETSHRLSMDYRFGSKQTLKNENQSKRYLSQFLAAAEAGEYASALEFYEKAFELVYPNSVDEEYSILYHKIRKMASKLALTSNVPNQDLFRGDKEHAVLARRSMTAFLRGEKELSMTFAHLALGALPESAGLKSYLVFLEENTDLKRAEDEVLAPAAWTKLKMRKAEAAFLSRKFADSIRICEQVLQVEPNHPLVHKRIGSSHFMLGEKGKALAAYRKALELEPTDQDLAEFIATNFK